MIAEIPNAADMLREAVKGTVFEAQDRFNPLLRDIRSLLQSLGGDVTAGNLSKMVRAGVYFLSTPLQRRDVIADFFDCYAPDVSAAEMLRMMGNM